MWKDLNELASDSEDDISLVGVSEPELEPESTENLQVPERSIPKKSSDIAKTDPSEVTPTLNKQVLNTLWKLYRNAGETVEDVISRLFNLPDGKWNWRDILSDDDRYDSSEDDLPESINTRTVDKESIYDGLLQNLIDAENDQMNENSGKTTCTDDFLDVTMSKSPQTSIKFPPPGRENEACESITPTLNDYHRKSKIRSKHDVPRLKPITTSSLVLHKPRRARRKPNSRPTRAANKRKKSTSTSLAEGRIRGPIVRDMYGVKTVSYDRPPPEQDQESKRILRLSEDSHSDGNDENDKKATASFDRDMVAHVTATGVRIVRKRPAQSKLVGSNEPISQPRLNLSSDSNSDAENTPLPKKRKIIIYNDGQIVLNREEQYDAFAKMSSPELNKRSLVSSRVTMAHEGRMTLGASDRTTKRVQFKKHYKKRFEICQEPVKYVQCENQSKDYEVTRMHRRNDGI
ncbi:hypothetical protein QAD02_001950 [Eretmocerus hayati]|uniref:Uncharacterized protein n=1 Tax=Eretmocerus hayati TaxID=131215 RepID=A0ACC2NJ85_9HYME|nr:hypothetical protein QAD02_001950 [Eretmocerus hayati]